MGKRIETTMRYAHFTVDVRVNEDSYSWHDPNVSNQFNFSVPIDVFSVEQLAKMINLHMKALNSQFEAEKARWEAEQKAKEEAERAKVEAEVSV